MSWLQLIQTYPGFTITMLIFGFATALFLFFIYALIRIIPRNENNLRDLMDG